MLEAFEQFLNRQRAYEEIRKHAMQLAHLGLAVDMRLKECRRNWRLLSFQTGQCRLLGALRTCRDGARRLIAAIEFFRQEKFVSI
jgi:hypothetical protein